MSVLDNCMPACASRTQHASLLTHASLHLSCSVTAAAANSAAGAAAATADPAAAAHPAATTHHAAAAHPATATDPAAADASGRGNQHVPPPVDARGHLRARGAAGLGKPIGCSAAGVRPHAHRLRNRIILSTAPHDLCAFEARSAAPLVRVREGGVAGAREASGEDLGLGRGDRVALERCGCLAACMWCTCTLLMLCACAVARYGQPLVKVVAPSRSARPVASDSEALSIGRTAVFLPIMCRQLGMG